MKTIPFSPPRIDDATISAVTEVLKSGWITTGPKTRLLEEKISSYTGSPKTLCLNSWTNAAELILRWYGVGPGDEVIVPVYTYAATANIVEHVGATPIPVDIQKENFEIEHEGIKKAITARTKVIMPVDIGGWPCDYDAIKELLASTEVNALFNPTTAEQKQLGRILLLSDAAHSFGAYYKGKHVGNECDIAGFSFHAVKNLTTAEGGAVTLNLPEPFDNVAIWKSLNISALHGQTKDALSKTQAGQWQYDIVEPGYKCNLTDIHAAIGLVEMERYDEETIPRRKAIVRRYMKLFSSKKWAWLPIFEDDKRESSYHLVMLRIRGIQEEQRNEIIQFAAQKGVSLNVHFQPLPLLSYYKNKGWKMSDFPNAWNLFQNEISLPVYYDLTDEQVDFIVNVLDEAVKQIVK